ncbi:MAG: ABC transporter permease, partial [Bacteroidetes bacterium]|nr:ABC transporter permease [Bacteroidota bacterium]
GRNKLYSFINISCLAIGIAVCLTIALYVIHERSYDQFHRNADRIFTITGTFKMGSTSVNINRFSYATGPMLQKADPRVEGYLRGYKPYGKINWQNPAQTDARFSEKQNMIFADSRFYEFFTLKLLRGNPALVLQRPLTVVLSENAARKYFGNTYPIGKTLRYNNEYDLEVTGVAANPPSNSSLTYDFVASISSLGSMKDLAPLVNSQSVQAGSLLTWLQLKEPSDARKVELTLTELSKTEKDAAGDKFILTALPETHLHMNFGDFSNTRYLSIFPLVAGLILLLALVNYMSLATARATTRAKEVGVRKVMGAGRSRIAGQFYTESALYALLAFVLGVGLFLWFRGPFLNLLQLKIDDSFLFRPSVLLFFGGLLVVVIVAAGSYPALVLSGFNPVAVLYGRLSRRRGGERVRKGFSVFQFTISMSLIICSVIIGKELYHIRHTETGVDRENVVMIPFSKTLAHYGAFKQKVGMLAGVRRVATAQFAMYDGTNAFSVKLPGTDKQLWLSSMGIDNDFIALTGLQWKRKPVSELDLYDENHIVINEAAIGKLELPADPVGHPITMGNKNYTIAGVMQNFNYQSLQREIEPLCLFVTKDTSYERYGSGCLFVKIDARVNIPTVIESLKKTYGAYDQQTAFEYRFMDEAFDNMYKAEDRLAAMFDVFTVITIVIACLGLFALATFTAEQRMREIGIRKVLGASAVSIGKLLSVDFLRPVLVAMLIASPLSWWAMNKWLDEFVYKTPFSWWIFPMAGLSLLGIALATILFQSVRAANANPVDNLRVE